MFAKIYIMDSIIYGTQQIFEICFREIQDIALQNYRKIDCRLKNRLQHFELNVIEAFANVHAQMRCIIANYARVRFNDKTV